MWPFSRRDRTTTDTRQLRDEVTQLRDAIAKLRDQDQRRDLVGLVEHGIAGMIESQVKLIEASTASAVKQRETMDRLDAERAEHRARLREARAERARARLAQGRDADGRILPANGHVHRVIPRVDY